VSAARRNPSPLLHLMQSRMRLRACTTTAWACQLAQQAGTGSCGGIGSGYGLVEEAKGRNSTGISYPAGPFDLCSAGRTARLTRRSPRHGCGAKQRIAKSQ
jgi:hypothetical protein